MLLQWVVTNINGTTYTITSFSSNLYLYCGQNLKATALAVLATQKQYYELVPVDNEKDTYT